MKHIYVNLKRFDVPVELGGVNRLATMQEWAQTIVGGVAGGIRAYAEKDVVFTMFFPEAHLLQAAAAVRAAEIPLMVGCQGVFRQDVEKGGNFGAFTADRPAAAARALGCKAVLIGHCEERRALLQVLQAGGADGAAVHGILNQEAACAIRQGLRVLYCVGETQEEQENWQSVLGRQLALGLNGLDTATVVIGYEPVWAIGPGKTPPDAAYIRKIAAFIKQETGGVPVVYGGGLKKENAAMLAGIEEIDGGLIALTRFAGEIGFYPEEYLEIIEEYTQNLRARQ